MYSHKQLPNDGDFAIHVHELGDITNTTSGESAGGHYIGVGSTTHGCPDVNSTRHEGDMGSWTAVGGSISQSKTLDLLALNGQFSIIGRSVVIHQLNDQCYGATGNAGSRLAIGVIGIANVANNFAGQDVQEFSPLICKLRGTLGNEAIGGTVWIKGQGTNTVFTAQIFNLDGQSHGFHIHQFGDISSSDGTSLGEHWNPNNKVHNLPFTSNRHVGDNGNIQSYASDGSAWAQISNELLSSPSTIVGRV